MMIQQFDAAAVRKCWTLNIRILFQSVGHPSTLVYSSVNISTTHILFSQMITLLHFNMMHVLK